jgi:hypothetical protein
MVGIGPFHKIIYIESVVYNGFYRRVMMRAGWIETEMLFQNEKSRTILIALLKQKSGI